MENLLREIDMARKFIRDTWIAVVMGGYGAPSGAPELKFDNIDKRRDYADSIIFGESLDLPEAGFFSRFITATNRIAELTQMGQPPWDMKPMLLNGPKARLSKKGTIYNIIPFRHGTSDKSGANAHFKAMPKDIYEAARQLAPTLSAGKRILEYGGKLTGTEGKYPPQKKTFFVPSGGNRMMKVGGEYRDGRLAETTHKTGIYEGMIKAQANYGKTASSQYLTFRVVSSKSPADSWWNPGRGAQPHIQFITGYCQPLIEKKMAEAAKQDLIAFEGVGMTIMVT